MERTLTSALIRELRESREFDGEARVGRNHSDRIFIRSLSRDDRDVPRAGKSRHSEERSQSGYEFWFKIKDRWRTEDSKIPHRSR